MEGACGGARVLAPSLGGRGAVLGRPRSGHSCYGGNSGSPSLSPHPGHGCATWRRAPPGAGGMAGSAGPWLGRRCPQLSAGCPSGSSLRLACGAAVEFGFSSAGPGGGEQKRVLQSKHMGKWGRGWEEGVGHSEGF